MYCAYGAVERFAQKLVYGFQVNNECTIPDTFAQ